MKTDSVQNTTSEVISDITVTQKLINGNTVLIVYYVLIFALFVFELFLYYNSVTFKPDDEKKTVPGGKLRRYFFRLYLHYREHGYMTINLILFITCMIMIFVNGHVDPREIVAIGASILIFSIIVRIVIRIFIGKNSYENESVARYINIIFYLLLGIYFCYFASFVSRPNLFLTYMGLLAALYLCFSVMLRAIFNPSILQKTTNDRLLYKEAYGILKGMFAILFCVILVLYMMVYSCWVTNPAFFTTSTDRVLDAWDMLFYTLSDFGTGTGDVIAMRPDGSYYAEFAVTVISLSSMFTTACFVGAVISSANTIARNTRRQYKQQINEDPDVSDNINDNIALKMGQFAAPLRTIYLRSQTQGKAENAENDGAQGQDSQAAPENSGITDETKGTAPETTGPETAEPEAAVPETTAMKAAALEAEQTETTEKPETEPEKPVNAEALKDRDTPK